MKDQAEGRDAVVQVQAGHLVVVAAGAGEPEQAVEVRHHVLGVLVQGRVRGRQGPARPALAEVGGRKAHGDDHERHPVVVFGGVGGGKTVGGLRESESGLVCGEGERR